MKRLALIPLAGLVLVAGCSAETKEFNAQDVTFAQDMIPHHQQAIEMSTQALTQGASPKVASLASRIQAAQGPEIQSMKGWLSAWGKPITTAASGGAHGGMSGMSGASGSTGSTGMMTDAQMGELSAAKGPQFDKLFLTMMIGHHEGAVTMSRTEGEKGKYAPAKQLAQSIIDGQEKEITEMRQLLTTQ